MNEVRPFIRVYELPDQLTNGYCFGVGVPIVFNNVDWFNAYDGWPGSKPPTKEDLEIFIKGKKYILPGRKYLVLGDDPMYMFVIGVL